MASENDDRSTSGPSCSFCFEYTVSEGAASPLGIRRRTESLPSPGGYRIAEAGEGSLRLPEYLRCAREERAGRCREGSRGSEPLDPSARGPSQRCCRRGLSMDPTL